MIDLGKSSPDSAAIHFPPARTRSIPEVRALSQKFEYIFIGGAYNIKFGKTYCSLRINIVGCRGYFYEEETRDSFYVSLFLCVKVENLININRTLSVNEIVGGALWRPGK